MPQIRSGLQITLLIVVSLPWGSAALGQSAGQINACASRKTEASGQYMEAVIDCRTRGVRQGGGAAFRCLQQATRKLIQAFTAIEQVGGCATIGDSRSVIDRVDVTVESLVAMLDPSTPNQCLPHQLKAMGRDAEQQHRCFADALAQGAGSSVEPECQLRASERFFTEFARASDGACMSTSDPRLIDSAIRAAASGARSLIKPPMTACSAVEVTGLHGPNLTGNSRLARITDGQVPCVHIDEATIASCAFVIADGRQSGEWLESPAGNFAMVGQAIALDGRPGGEYVIAARVSDGEPPACIEPAGMDTMGRVADGFELASTCVVEDLLTAYNAGAADWGWTPLWNYADREVCTSNDPAINPHPDGATLTRSYAQSGIGPADTFCYSGYGAALNDINGAERDWLGQYYVGENWCHYIHTSGVEVPAAKRPATFSLPAPGRINTRSPILWRPVNPHVTIANGSGPPVGIQTFASKHDFLNQTAATEASGPLPDLGAVGTSVTIGSITFSLALGGDSLAVGASGTPAAPDWYPELAGHDIALGYENLQLQFAAPVYSFGFEFAEPNVTMPPFGGVPGDSTFEIVMYRGSAEVGRATFNAPDDQAGFIGVWSSLVFDRATIIDLSGNDDDEFFGQFFTGRMPR